MAKKPIKKNLVKLERLKIEDLDINSILPNQYNPNRQSDKDFELLCRSIEEDGFTQPILVHEKTKEIVDGEHRWRACKVLGWETIPVVFVNMTREQMMVSTLRHNRARGNEDIEMAADVLRDLQNLGALDHAADSLMLDDVELSIMLEDIPQAQLVLRKPGEKLSAQEVQLQVEAERAFEKKKQEEDQATAEEEDSHLTMIFRMYSFEKVYVERVLETLEGRNASDQIVALCRKYDGDPDAEAYMGKESDVIWDGTQYVDRSKNEPEDNQA